MRGTKAQRHEGTKGKMRGIVPSSSWQLPTGNYRAFTLTEILIVIGIIVLMLALAVPAFNFITGSRSQNGAENVISAMLGRARSYAIQNNVDAGVIFFSDTVTSRTTMAVVTRGLNNSTSGSSSAEDAYYNYRAWTFASFNNPNVNAPPSPTQYYQSNEVIAPVQDNASANPALYPVERTLVVKRFVAGQDNVANNNTQPDKSPWIDVSGAASSVNASQYVDVLPDGDFQVLPPGVGCQLINDPKLPGANGRNPDRYVRTGVIMFDPQGRLESIPIAFYWNSLFGSKIGVQQNVNQGVVPPAGASFYSQLGVVLFDKEAFLTKGFSESDTVLSGGNPSYGSSASGNAADEYHEEVWLDLNSTPLYLDRYNGTVLKGE